MPVSLFLYNWLASLFSEIYNMRGYPRMGKMKTFAISIILLLLPFISSAGPEKELRKSGGIRVSMEVVKPPIMHSPEDTQQSGKKTPPEKAK